MGVVTLVLLPLGVTGVVALDTDELVALPLLDVDVGSVDVGFLVTVGLAGLATLEASLLLRSGNFCILLGESVTSLEAEAGVFVVVPPAGVLGRVSMDSLVDD